MTGHVENGKAGGVGDTAATQFLERPSRPGIRLTNFGIERGDRAERDGRTETCPGHFVLHPPPMGSTFRRVEFLPEDPDVLNALDGKAALGEMGASAQVAEGSRHPYMHRTDSLDCAIALSGETWMDLDDEADDLPLRAGDALIQRGNNHAWSNRDTEPCGIAFVLIDGVTRRDAPESRQMSISRQS